MRKPAGLATMACAALLPLAFAVGTASANRAIRIEPAGPAVNAGFITITEPLGGPALIRCELSLELEYVRIIQKQFARNLAGGQIGTINGGAAAACVETGGLPWLVTILAEALRPVPMRYDAFLGILPVITGILITALNFGIKVSNGLTVCLFAGELPFLIFESMNGPNFNRKRLLPNALTLVEGNCPIGGTIELRGTLTIAPAQRVTLV
jgi:hypothetical protein